MTGVIANFPTYPTPFVDPKTGIINFAWYQLLVQLSSVGGGITNLPSDTVFGNISGETAPAVPVAIADLIFGLPLFTATNSGIVPASGGSAFDFLSADGSWKTPPIFTNVSSGYVPLSPGGILSFLRADGSWAVPDIFTTSTPGYVPTSPGGTTDFLRADGTWASISAGTVTSVGLTMPGIYTVGGSPVTTAGTLAVTLNAQAINTAWMGPSSGSAATPTFRFIAEEDSPEPNLIGWGLASGSPIPFPGGGNATTAIGAAQTAGRTLWVPYGIYGTSSLANANAVTIPLRGFGQIQTADSNRRGKIFNNVTSPPAQVGFIYGGIDAGFNGDWTKNGIAIEQIIQAGGLLPGPPLNGYNTPQANSIFVQTTNYSGGFYNPPTDGRTIISAYTGIINHLGQGDSLLFSGSGNINSAPVAGYTSWLSYPAIGLAGGNFGILLHPGYLNAFEIDLSDNGTDSACFGHNIFMSRTNAVGNLGAQWVGLLLDNFLLATSTVYPVGTLSWSGGVVTVTLTIGTFGFVAGNTYVITITGASPGGYNGTFSALATANTPFGTLVYNLVSNPGGTSTTGSMNIPPVPVDQGIHILGPYGIGIDMCQASFPGLHSIAANCAIALPATAGIYFDAVNIGGGVNVPNVAIGGVFISFNGSDLVLTNGAGSMHLTTSAAIFSNTIQTTGIIQASGNIQTGSNLFALSGDVFVQGGGGGIVIAQSPFANQAASGAGTLTNAPFSGNPTKWIALNDGGTIRSVPTW